MDKSDDSLLVIKEQIIKEPISGLKLKFRKTNHYSIITISGDSEFGYCDFYFTKNGKFDGTGIGVGKR